MSTTLSISPVSVQVGWNYQSVLTWANAVNASNFAWSRTLANGTGAGNADVLYVAQPTLAASATTSLDLAGAITDVFGNTITFAKVKMIYLELTAVTTASSISLGGAASNAFINWVGDATDKVVIRNGGVFFLGCTDGTGYAVTASTGDLLKITNNDGSNVATMNLLIAGE